MATLLTKHELEVELEDFRHLLSDFDYSSIKNITFLNLDAFLAYMENVEGNPFKLQYNALQKKLDILQPYLPFVSSQRANEFLEALSQTHNDEEIKLVKKEFTKKGNKLIEFDGKQHFELGTRGWYSDETDFLKAKQRDIEKNQYALKHNIPLIRIPYWERDNITLEMLLGNKYSCNSTK